MKSSRCGWGLLWLLLAGGLAGAQERPGTVEFSDHTKLSGNLSLTPGSQLKLQAGKEVRMLDFDRVAELRLAPEREDMERAWRFKEAGQTAKEYYGDPYPVRYLAATVTLDGGEKLTGHLFTTVLYVVKGDDTQKVLLLAKQRGKEGETLPSLVYPQTIAFGDAAVRTETAIHLRLTGVPAGAQVVGLTRGALVQLVGRAAGAAGDWQLPSPLGAGFFLAAQSGNRIIVGWPAARDEALVARLQQALLATEDFFDDRRVLGAWVDPADSGIYSLVLAARGGQTTLDEARSQPWRLEIYRWKQDEDGRVMLAGHDHFFRGIAARGVAPPRVELSEPLWNLHAQGDIWTDAKP